MTDLLVEIGTEEIPASYIEPALNALSAGLLKKMDEMRISYGKSSVFGTPRRLAVKITDVADKQKSITTQLIGPPERVGFDNEGKITLAAEKFAEKAGISVDQIAIKKTNKGSYLSAKKIEDGLASETVLQDILPDLILSIPFPKTMRWSDLDINFARPIHSITALFGRKIIPFMLGNIKSGRYAFGHSFMNPEKVELSDPSVYIGKLLSAHVLVDINERKNLVEKNISKAADELGGKVLSDTDLVETVTNLVEYPVAVAGKFDKKFLELPDEVLITAMREHQKYFAVVNEEEKLMPCFIAVNNTCAKDMTLVAKGHERVLRARLEDARFFYTSDISASLDTFVDKLKTVIFQAKLGSIYEKALRIQKITDFLADRLHGSLISGKKLTELKIQLSRAALLCKADLVSQVVVEFPKLQGIMGRIYAAAEKETDEVAVAIEEHYRPTFSGGPLPETTTGAILSIADKIDSICGCFRIGLIPTGASDPYALRRQGIGIIQIILDKKFSFSLKELIEKSVKLFKEKNDQQVEETINEVYLFLQNRISHLLAEEGYSKDVIASVLAVSKGYATDTWKKVQALQELKQAADFEPLAVTFKRVVNIIKKSCSEKTDKPDKYKIDVDETLFQHESESKLYSRFLEIRTKVFENLDKGLFNQALVEIASIRDIVDHFFDSVLVMEKDDKIRSNRLALLSNIASVFEIFADFSKIST